MCICWIYRIIIVCCVSQIVRCTRNILDLKSGFFSLAFVRNVCRSGKCLVSCVRDVHRDASRSCNVGSHCLTTAQIGTCRQLGVKKNYRYLVHGKFVQRLPSSVLNNRQTDNGETNKCIDSTLRCEGLTPLCGTGIEYQGSPTMNIYTRMHRTELPVSVWNTPVLMMMMMMMMIQVDFDVLRPIVLEFRLNQLV